MATGSEICDVISGPDKTGLRPPYSQQIRADEAALLVSQYRVTSSSTSSGDFSGSVLSNVQCENPGCPSSHAASPAGESEMDKVGQFKSE